METTSYPGAFVTDRGAHVIDAYNTSRACALSKAWAEETTNGLDGDFGDLEHKILSEHDNGQFHASYKYRAGPTIGMCYQTNRCGWQPPYGVRQKCDPAKPWLVPHDKVGNKDHRQLEEVMGINKCRLAGDNRPAAASTYAHTRSLQRDPTCTPAGRHLRFCRPQVAAPTKTVAVMAPAPAPAPVGPTVMEILIVIAAILVAALLIFGPMFA